MSRRPKRLLYLLSCVSFLIGLLFPAQALAYNPANQLPSLTGIQADDIVNVAESQVGYVENDGTVYGKEFGAQYADWCVYFIYWCALNANITSDIIPYEDKAAAGYGYASAFNDIGTRRLASTGYVPQRGDIAVYSYYSATRERQIWCHVGLVTSSTKTNGGYPTVEGNLYKPDNRSYVQQSQTNLYKTYVDGSDVSEYVPVYEYITPNYAISNHYGDFVFASDGGQVEITGYTGSGGAVQIPAVITGKPVTKIGTWAFYQNSNVKSIQLPDSVVNIDDCAFDGCSSLESAVLPAALQRIGAHAFSSCNSLKTITIPGSVGDLGNGAFSGCEKLTSIAVEGSNGHYASQDGVLYDKDMKTLLCYPAGKFGAFAIPAGVTEIDGNAFAECKLLSSITFPSELLRIGPWAFMACNSLQRVTIPKSVTYINSTAFMDCTSLSGFDVDAGSQNYSDIDGILYDKDHQSLVICPALKYDTLAIPEGVCDIYDSAFYHCRYLTSVVIPDSVSYIGTSAFEGCTGLRSVTLPDGLDTLPDSAFNGCTSLTSVVIPDSVTKIEAYAFTGCADLQNVTIPASVTSMGGGVFWNCSALQSAYFLGDAPADFGDCMFLHCSGQFKIYFNDGATGWTTPTWTSPAGEVFNTERKAVISHEPTVPQNVRAASASYNSISVSWTASQNAASYQVYRAPSASGPWSLASTTSSTSAACTGLSTNATYYFKVRACASSGGKPVCSAYSSVVSAKPVPSAPSSAKAASASYSSIRVSWTAVGGATMYELYRCTSRTGTYKLVTTTSALSYVNTGLATGTAYYYKVRAYRSVSGLKVYGAYSPIVSARPTLLPPSPVRAARASATSIKVSWGASAGASGYEVWRSTSSGGTYSLVKAQTSATFVNTGLVKGRTYYYKVRAYRVVSGKKVYSAYSPVVSAKTY